MDSLSSTVGIVAIASGAVAVVALGVSAALAARLRRLRSAQRAVLGDGSRDLVAHAAHLEQSYESLAAYVEDAMNHLDRRVTHAERRLDGAISYRALVRYDAWGEMSGRQSTSIALLDASRSGVVLSSIHHRDHALVYAKQVHNGEGELELSPEEQEAIRLAVAAGPVGQHTSAEPGPVGASPGSGERAAPSPAGGQRPAPDSHRSPPGGSPAGGSPAGNGGN